MPTKPNWVFEQSRLAGPKLLAELIVSPPRLRFGAAAFAFTPFKRRLVPAGGIEPPTKGL